MYVGKNNKNKKKPEKTSDLIRIKYYIIRITIQTVFEKTS